ncbi:MAG: hypothetical protein HYX40_02765 [Sphingobacteriales bacterium]|nr:hypothetical protein [Sphingobacteriales bacterium]
MRKITSGFSVNGFRRLVNDSNSIRGVSLYPVKNIEGVWSGMEHDIRISSDTTIAFYANGIVSYGGSVSFTAELMDPIPDTKNAKLDTSVYRLLFVKIAGQLYIELLSADKTRSWHDFILPAKTYLRINKMTRDTVIVQMLKSDSTAKWLKENSYHYFIPTRYSNTEPFPLYISEDPVKLAEIIKRIDKVPGVYQPSDTILRKWR